MRRARGFTLVELMVVLVIVSIVSVGAVVLIGPGLADVERAEARRFTALYDLAYEEAQLQGSTRAIAVGRRGYAFFRRQSNGGWEALEDEVFLSRSLDEEYRLALLIDGIDVELLDELPETPQLWLSPGGATRPFVLLLKRADTGEEVRRFEVDALGRRSWRLARG